MVWVFGCMVWAYDLSVWLGRMVWGFDLSVWLGLMIWAYGTGG